MGVRYGGEGCFVDLEKLQIAMGKKILRCGSRMTEEVVRGELGWERHVARRDEMRLKYWAKLVRIGDERIAKIIYKTSRRSMQIDKRFIERASSCRVLAHRSFRHSRGLE